MHLNYRRLVAECIGTFFLVLMGTGTIMVNVLTPGSVTHVGIALTFAFVVTVVIIAFGPISGAHINPAVTLALWSAQRFSGKEVLPYITAQCFGAIAASLALRATIDPVGMIGATVPSIGSTNAFVIEALMSFILMTVILTTTTNDRVTLSSAAIGIGVTVGMCALVGGPITGASMNPARNFGPALAGSLWENHWVYWIGPILGMFLAVRVHEWLHAAQSEYQLEHIEAAQTAPLRHR